MPHATCPACEGSGRGAGGGPCWGCNGHGFVELTRDDEADVVRRGDVLVDRKRGRVHQLSDRGHRLHPFFQLVLSGGFWVTLGGTITAIVFATQGSFTTASFLIAVLNCLLAGLLWGAILGLFEPLFGLTERDDFFDLLKRLGLVVFLIIGAVKVASLSAAQHGVLLWALDWNP